MHIGPGVRLAVVALPLALGACGGADFSRPVSQFATATRDVERAVIAIDDSVRADMAAAMAERAVADPAVAVGAAQGDCLADGSTRCRLIVDGVAYPPPPPLGDMLAAMAAVSHYAGSLQGIIGANSARAVAAHEEAALGSASRLEALAGSPSDKPAKPSSKAGAVVSWVVGAYLERERQEALQRATAAARQPIADLAGRLAETGELFTLASRAGFAERLSSALDRFHEARGSDDEAALAGLRAASATARRYDTLLAAKPAAVFAAMASAHSALADAAAGDEPSTVDLGRRMQTFASMADELAALLENLGDAGGSREGS